MGGRMFTDGFMFIMNKVLAGICSTFTPYKMGMFCGALLVTVVVVALLIGIIALLTMDLD